MVNIPYLHPAILDILPNPVLVKDNQLRYVLINKAFEDLFKVRREDLIGQLDKDVFKERQAVQCNGGDLRVLDTGEIDEAYETVFKADNQPRKIITRKSRLIGPDGATFLVGILHDITDISQANQKLEQQQQQLEEKTAELYRMAHTDPLTGCSNRRAFSLNSDELFSDHRRGHRNYGSLLMIDIDHFKRINDTYGHDVGDLALVHLVKIMNQLIRRGDILARLGGEEFAITLLNATVQESTSIAERICETVASTPFMHETKPISMTVSIGVIYLPEPHKFDLDRAMIKGDSCLYKAKSAGRNRVICETLL